MERMTPKTTVSNDAASGGPTLSTPHVTATIALVIGSAAYHMFVRTLEVGS